MYDRILVPFDGSPTSERALAEATRLAKLCSASVRLLHVVDPLTHITGFERPDVYVSEIIPAMRRAAEDLLAKAHDAVAADGVPVETALIESHTDRVSDVVVEQARAWPADLIVIGTHGRRGVDRVLMGSDAEQVARRSPVPVLLVRLG
ncbi:MAG: universal stress protein [Burkholderiales bacterium]|nr:MAG: universal stress protein [Burkholderiales bacterium]